MTSSPNNVLIIGFVWPEPGSSAAGGRMMQLTELFLAQDWKVTFACAAADSDFAFDVTTLGVDKVNIELNNESFDVFIKTLQPTIVLFDRFNIEEQFGWRVSEHCPTALRILDTEDLHSLRRARQLAFKEKRAFTNADLMSDVAKREVASIFRCDISLIISEVEMELLKTQFKVDEALLHYLPFMAEPMLANSIEALPGFEERKHFICIGNFLHEPNWNAVLYLKEEIWPLVSKQLPDAELHIYGAYASQKVLALHNLKQRFLVKGRAENAKKVVSNARVCLAPLRFGAGLKGKLLEAMQCNTPSVTTSIGAEGMAGNLPWSGIVAHSTAELADAAVRLYTDKIFWLQSQKNGIEIINTRFQKSILKDPFLKRILTVQLGLEKHRQDNFTGAMLMQHTTSSTRYMAKWIEAKSR